MENQHEVTREQMDQTRASLSEKIESLEQQVVDTVHDATHAVSQTVADVKDAVHKTVESVKDNFDLRVQVEREPWAMVGGSLAVGFLGGYLLFRHGTDLAAANPSSPAPAGRPMIAELPNGHAKAARLEDGASAKPDTNGVAKTCSANGVDHQFEKEIGNLKRLAIGTLLSLVRDLVTKSAPKTLEAGLTNVMDGITVQLGGDPIQGPVLRTGDASTS
jgi:ElaB/YqjD/DUF883 family membrane-anchored ribosome-binding protein